MIEALSSNDSSPVRRRDDGILFGSEIAGISIYWPESLSSLAWIAWLSQNGKKKKTVFVRKLWVLLVCGWDYEKAHRSAVSDTTFRNFFVIFDDPWSKNWSFFCGSWSGFLLWNWKLKNEKFDEEDEEGYKKMKMI